MTDTLTMKPPVDLPLRNRYLRTSNYDVSNTCNLRCEGCLYFSGAGEEISRAETDIAVWQAFLRPRPGAGSTLPISAVPNPR
ncbi:hypothetical protein [Gemmobacter sp.]|uniref:hypothetical protein n=1 Tax=Gemmobacter sp. TaxID=1898957 RepID=UPI002AFFD0D0|nr:hypothetical protein [Gemmobacter sp.]